MTTSKKPTITENEQRYEDIKLRLLTNLDITMDDARFLLQRCEIATDQRNRLYASMRREMI